MKYFFIATDGKRYGPADVVTLRQWVQEGRITGQSLLEEEGTGRQIYASNLQDLGLTQVAPYSSPPQTPYPREGSIGYGGIGLVGSPPKNYLIESILVTIFCCWPTGIAAIIFAAQVNTHWVAGRADEALKSSNSARTWTLVSFIVGLVAMIGYFIFVISTGFAAFAPLL